MECKEAYENAVMLPKFSIDLTRMECKDMIKASIVQDLFSIDLTRMECKGRYIWE